MSRRVNRRTAAAVWTALAAMAVPGVGSARAADAPQHCGDPTGPADFRSLSPSAAGVDPAALDGLLDWAAHRNSASVRVYRHGCLIGASRMDAVTQDLPRQWQSASKGVNAMVVGRALQLGLLSLSDPVSKFFPEADEAHGRILLRDLITQSGGLRFSWTGDSWNNSFTDGVRIALHQEVVHPPGTYFEYQQHGLTLLLGCVQRAVGGDVQEFIQGELFGKLGIERDDWFWVRDRAGWTAGWYGLEMSPRLAPRLAQLMLNEGVWNGERLLPEQFVREARSSNPVNGGYGYLLWTNHGDNYWTTGLPGRHFIDRPLVPSAPRDLYVFAGAGGEHLYVIPSLDIVIERSGDPPSHDTETDGSRGGAGGEFSWELFRLLNRAVTDTHWNDPGPYQPIDLGPVDPGAAFDAEGTLAGPGVGPRAGGCNVAGCDGKTDFSGYERQRDEAARYSVNAPGWKPLRQPAHRRFPGVPQR
ncbi:MAG: serine hydrolase [Actinobacteria bacterium]|nr:serine hydrolase [Actinomycetota bacterium]